MASLIITINEQKHGFELPAILGKRSVIGSDDECDITLKDAEGVSRRHCCITCTEEGFRIEDLGSTNGTFANTDEVTEPTYMKEGVVYTIGKASMLIAELANFAPAPENKQPVPSSRAATVPLPETEPQEQAPQPVPNTISVTPPGPRKLVTGNGKRRPLSAEELKNKAKLLANSFKGDGISITYVVIIIIAAFYAGMVLYSWGSEGTTVPFLFR
ncbi:MAG: FHA domain-containing protein [Akkermansia sp.]|nr:FHA domain-containing protein [Akkermansia sp.]